MARDFDEGGARNGGRKSQGWWDWKSSKIALEYLWRTGGLAVAKRIGFQKVYDLTGRVVPGAHLCDPANAPDDSQLIDWACREAIKRLGFGSPGEIARFFDLITPAEAKAWCECQTTNRLIPIILEGVTGAKPRKIYAVPELEDWVLKTPAPPKRIRTLSPFDPIVRDRKRLHHLFFYDYRIEIFVPEEKRQYGYYVFPLLEGDKMIGRIDMTASGSDQLTVKKLWLEPGIKMSAGRRNGLLSEIHRISALAGVAPPASFPF